MTVSANRQPFARPDYTAVTSKAFWRGTAAHVLGTLKSENPEGIIDRHWRGDEAAKYVARAVSSVANTTTTGWARDLAPIGMAGNVLVTLAPAAAATRLYEQAVQLDFTGINQIVVPRVVTPPTATWVAEGGATNFLQPVLGNVVVGPLKKILIGAAVTSELERYTPQTASRVIEATLSEAVAVAIDSALLDNAAADALRPAGLQNGLSTLGATAGGGIAALVADLGKICGAMATAKISSEGAMFFMSGGDAVRARGLLSVIFGAAYTIVSTPALTAGTIVGVAPSAIAMAFGPPQIEVSREALIHFADDAHANIDTAAVSETVKSAWQADLLALKVRLRTIWAPLATGAVQMISSVTW
jgi:hypothetical protein